MFLSNIFKWNELFTKYRIFYLIFWFSCPVFEITRRPSQGWRRGGTFFVQKQKEHTLLFWHCHHIQEKLDISGLKVWIGKMQKGKLSHQSSINRSVKLFQMKCKTLGERKAVNKKWSSFSFLLQTEADEKPNKGINSTENSFDTFSYL